jgi:hypothetical protein
LASTPAGTVTVPLMLVSVTAACAGTVPTIVNAVNKVAITAAVRRNLNARTRMKNPQVHATDTAGATNICRWQTIGLYMYPRPHSHFVKSLPLKYDGLPEWPAW